MYLFNDKDEGIIWRLGSCVLAVLNYDNTSQVDYCSNDYCRVVQGGARSAEVSIPAQDPFIDIHYHQGATLAL